MNARVLLSHRARRVFIFIHLWLGLVIGLWFSLIGLSGSVLAWRSELTAMELRAKFPVEKPSANAPMISLSQAIAIGKPQSQTPPSEAPPSEALTITIPNSRMPFYSVVQGRARRGQMTLIDPYSGRWHPAVNTRDTLTGTIQQFHQRLIAGARGYVANGFFNVLAVPLVLSGLWLWWPKNVAQLRARLQVKRGTSLKRKLYDLHNVMGIYLYGILFVTTLTGAMLVTQHIAADGGIRAFLSEETPAPTANARGGESRGENRGRGDRGEARGGAGRAAGNARGEGERSGANRPVENRAADHQTQTTNARGAEQRGGRGESEAPEVVVSGTRLSNEKILEIARGVRPQWELTRLQLPAQPNQAVAATFQKPSGFTNSETVYLDPYRGQIVTSAARDESFNVRSWTRLLHLGEFGGVLSKLLYTLTGLMPLGLFVTGVWMWANKKFRKRTPKTVAVEERELVA